MNILDWIVKKTNPTLDLSKLEKIKKKKEKELKNHLKRLAKNNIDGSVTGGVTTSFDDLDDF